MKKYLKNKNIRNYIIILLFLIVVFEVLSIFSVYRPHINEKDNTILNKYAEEVISICAKTTDHPDCYDREIPKLMDNISMEDAFRVTSIIQDRDSSYPYCHVLGHELSAREVSKDPSKWKEVLTRCPVGECSNGCLHGGLQERFRGTIVFSEEQIKNLENDLSQICEKRDNWNPTGLEQASCYHAVGHLAMYITGADVKKSSKICDSTAIKSDGRNFVQTCYDANFMQLFQPLEGEDRDLIAGKEVKKEELPTFCSKFSGLQRESCWHEGWPLFASEIIRPDGLMQYCNSSVLLNDADKDHCFLSLFYVLVVQLKFDISRISSFCSALPKNRMEQCFANTASRLIETDYRNTGMVSNYCSTAPTYDAKSRCYSELVFYSTFNYHPASKEFYDLCNSLPDPWKDQCLDGKNSSG